jgi:PAS domain S-box-containing protein
MTDNLRRSISSGNGSSQNMPQGMAEVHDQTTAEVADSPERQSDLALDIQALQILDSSDDCIKVLDLDGRILFMSRGEQVLLGIQDITPFLNTSWVEFWQEGDRQAAMDAIAHARAGEVCTFQGYRPTPSGEPKWWDIKISPIRGTEGQVERLLCISRDITERRQIEDQRKQAEEKLRESEERYRAIINQAVTGVVCSDLDGNLTLVNQKYCDITGYWADELSQRRMQDITHPEDLPRNVELFHRMRTEGTPFEIEKRYIRKDGSIVWVNNSVSAIRDQDGKPQSAVAIVLDITERKQAELSAEFLATIAQDLAEATSVEDIIQTIGEQLNRYLQTSICAFVEINESAEVATIHHSWHHSEVPSLVGVYRLAEFVTDEFFQTAKAGRTIIVRDVTTDPRIADPERFALLKIGSFINVPLIRDNEWKFALGIYHQTPYNWRSDEIELMRELANRIWTKLERTRVEAALRENEEQFRTLTATIPQLIWTATPDGSVDYLSDQWADYIGLPPEQFYDWSWQQITHSEDLPNTLRKWEHSLGSGEPLEIQHRFRYRTGEWRWQLVRGVPIKDATGNIKKWVGTCTDIQNEVDIKEALRESEERFRLMADAVPQIVWITDSDGRVEFFNKQWSNHTGVPYEPTTAAEVAANFVHPDDGALTMEAFNQARQTGSTFTVEHRIRAADGTYRWFLVKAEPYRHPETGEIIRWFGASIDIHDRKLAEAAIAADLRDTQLLRDLSARLTTETDIQVLYDEILAAAIALTQADAGSFQFFNQVTQELVTSGCQRWMVIC